MKFAILGGGSWGSALAITLAKNNNSVKVWEFFPEQAQEMQEKRVCKLLPDATLPDNIFISHKIEEVLFDTEAVLLVVPSDKVEATIGNAKHLFSDQPVIICSKGFGEGLQLLSESVQKQVGGNAYCLYGPTHAEEVCHGMFSGIVLAGKEGKERQLLQEAFHSPVFNVEVSDDIIGVQLCAALKNILAVFVGVLDGKRLGDNAKAYVITKGLDEIKMIGLKMGAKPETFYGLAGIGDVIVTATSKHSRNRHVGEQVGKGKKLEEVLAEMNMVAEGVTALKRAIGFKEKLGLHLPLIEGLYQILFEGKDVEEVLAHLSMRSGKAQLPALRT
ncbi:MAG TPA: NAD(P)H-dependent glycerol-3-phosphate dehydrogenase [Candidatus Nanoarchaeia archaeon]|nr:NAD(P)H-dependent glycerol-3-phosphate dehydrogenase [Candidatus Nanoarchaeia archaeon]